MKVYSYSTELLTFVEVKWILAKFVVGGILVGTIIFIGFMNVNQSGGNAFESRSTNTLAAENDILRQQVSLMSPRVSRLEMQLTQFNEHAAELRMLLHPRKIVRDTVSSFTNATKGLKLRSPIPVAASFSP